MYLSGSGDSLAHFKITIHEGQYEDSVSEDVPGGLPGSGDAGVATSPSPSSSAQRSAVAAFRQYFTPRFPDIIYPHSILDRATPKESSSPRSDPDTSPEGLSWRSFTPATSTEAFDATPTSSTAPSAGPSPKPLRDPVKRIDASGWCLAYSPSSVPPGELAAQNRITAHQLLKQALWRDYALVYRRTGMASALAQRVTQGYPAPTPHLLDELAICREEMRSATLILVSKLEGVTKYLPNHQWGRVQGFLWRYRNGRAMVFEFGPDLFRTLSNDSDREHLRLLWCCFWEIAEALKGRPDLWMAENRVWW